MQIDYFYIYSKIGQIWMQIFVVVTLIYMLYKHYKDSTSILLILLCWPRVFMFWGKTTENPYKVLMLLLCFLIALKCKVWKAYKPREKWIVLVFAIFSVQFFLSTTLYSQGYNTVTIVFSQYARYLEIFLLYFIIKDAIFRRGKKEQLLYLFYEIGLMQILISIVKLIAFRQPIEGLVGSFSIAGGAMGTTIPILWFIVLWLYRKGQFQKWDWLYILGLLFVGFTSSKRAVMLVLPVVVCAFLFFVQGIKLKRYAIGVMALIPLLFYLGVRLTPTLNPENKIWGTFEWEYVWDYAESYQFGKQGIEGQMKEYEEERALAQFSEGKVSFSSNKLEADGRGGATIAILKLFMGIHPSNEQDWWGLGFSSMYSSNYAEFAKLPLTIQLNHKGSSSGFFQNYVTTGLWGALCNILFGFIFCLYFRNKRLGITIAAVCAWEYFMYTGFIFRTPAFMAVLFIVLHFTNYDALQYKYSIKNS